MTKALKYNVGPINMSHSGRRFFFRKANQSAVDTTKEVTLIGLATTQGKRQMNEAAVYIILVEVREELWVILKTDIFIRVHDNIVIGSSARGPDSNKSVCVK